MEVYRKDLLHMDRTVKLDVEVPDFLDDEFIQLLSSLNYEELSVLKTFIKCDLYASGRYTLEQLDSISKNS